MRPQTERKIEALHQEIARLITLEKRHHDRTHPRESWVQKAINHTRIEYMAESPVHRALLRNVNTKSA